MKLSHLQQGLCLEERRFEQADLTEWSAKFGNLFSIDVARAHAAFIATPAQLRALLYELLALAGRAGVNMETAVWAKYPGVCPYCLTMPCSCSPQKARPHERLSIPLPQAGLTLGEFQRMFAGIYLPRASLVQECADVISEVAESSLAVYFGDSRGTEEEFADAFARLMRVANTLGIDIQGIIP